MAIDTQAKRYSLLGLVNLDGTVDQSDRQTMLGLYGGVLAGEVSAAVGLVYLSVSAARRPRLTASAARRPSLTASAGRRPRLTASAARCPRLTASTARRPYITVTED